MFGTIYGVDFSGAKLAGRNTWVARVEAVEGRHTPPYYRLAVLRSLETICGTSERAPALAHLVERIAGSEGALWALDFPFGLPLEVMEPGDRWPDQLDLLRGWGEGAYALGVECLRRAKARGGPNHIRRLTDQEEKAPFDSYHYRIIYQTFHGMRDVLGPLARARGTAILPFHYGRLAAARRVLVEACPASTLKRLGLPHNNHKQPAGGPLTRRRLRVRQAILAGLAGRIEIAARQRRTILRNGGGDALDAVLAAVGALRAWGAANHWSVARHPRYPREGRLFV
jgi:hypothetical protein